MNNKINEELQSILALKIEDDFKIDQLEKMVVNYKMMEATKVQSFSIDSVFQSYLYSDLTENDFYIKTNWPDIDDKLGGFKLGEFIVIGGRPAMGKTALLLDLIRRISADIPVLYISLESNAIDISNRLVASLLQTTKPFRSPQDIRELDAEKLDYISEFIKKMQLTICDSAFYSMYNLRNYCEKMVQEKGVKIIVLDYLQLLSTQRYKHNRELEINYICQKLKRIAMDLNICLIVTSQLSRAVEQRGGDKRPALSDLRESGTIEQIADKVFFVYRPEYYGFTQDENGESTVGRMELSLLKNKSGMNHTFHFIMNHPTKITPIIDHDGQFDFKLREKYEIDELKDETPF